MPYIGASNNSNYSFRSLKEKHAIKESSNSEFITKSLNKSNFKFDNNNTTTTTTNIDDTSVDKENDESISSSLSSSSVVSPTKEYRPFSASVISQSFSSNNNIDNLPDWNNPSKRLNSTANISQEKIVRMQSTGSITSSITDVDIQELFTLPNESTHCFSYNPLSPNSLAVRLSILKRSLEIIIANPKMMENDTSLDSPVVNNMKQQSSLLRNPNVSNKTYGQLRTYVSTTNMANMASRRFSVAAEDPLSNYQQRKWTSPTAALNAFVTNPAISNNDNNYCGFVNDKISLKHRTNSLAILPKLWTDSTFDFGNNNNNNNNNKLKSNSNRSRSQSNIFLTNVLPNNSSDRSVRKVSNQEELKHDLYSSTSSKNNDNNKSYNDEEDYSYIEEQRANLISLLDLLNETLENNTSEKATDLHMLSLYNIDKLILDEDKENTPSPMSSTSNTNLSNIVDEKKHTRKLKKILLDSLAEPFFERNISFEESLLEDEVTLEHGLDEFVETNGTDNISLNSTKPKQQDYGRILHTFTSAKNSAPQAIFTCTQQHPWQFKAANDLACLIFGISKNVLKALTLLDLIHTDSRSFVLHKLLTTEDQELVFTGEIIGIVQPGASNNGLIWASFWAKRKNGLLVCVFEKVPCDYVDVLLDINTFEVEKVINKNNLLKDSVTLTGDETTNPSQNHNNNNNSNNSTDTTPILGKYGSAHFQVGNNSPSTSSSNSEYNSDAENDNMTTPILIDKTKNKKTVKFANMYQSLGSISQSLAKLIDQVRDGTIHDPDDSLLSMPVRISNHVNRTRYFTINQSTSNIPCAVSCSVLEDQIKLKIHSLPYQAGLFVIDSHTLQLISFNKSISKNMFGHHLFELVDSPITRIIPCFKDMIDYIHKVHPNLILTLPKNRGLVLTEHFFRKLKAEMDGDPKSFYTSTGIDGVHIDGSKIKVDFQVRVLNSNYCFVWITHSRDVALEDYKANPSQLKMLKETELSYMSSSGSSIASSKKSTIKASVTELKEGVSTISLRDDRSETERSISPDTDSKITYKVQNISTSSVVTSIDDAELPRSQLHTDPTEVEIKERLSQLYSKDKSQFVKDDNFKVDKTLIISKISSTPTPEGETIKSTLSSSSVPADYKLKTNIDLPSERQLSNVESNINNFQKTTFLHTPSRNIGSFKRVIKFSDFVILKNMGEGAYGKVNLCMHKREKYIVVIKMIFKERILVDTWVRDRKLGTIPSEIQIMATLNKQPHENILKLLDFFEDDEYYYIETPVHGETGCIDLFDLIELKTNMTEFEAKLIFKQIVSGVKHLHDLGIVHRDIKDENVIVDSKGFVKLIDFGSAAYVKSGPFDVFVGTIDYAAPEVLSGDPYEGKPQDIWAIGILLYTIIFKENPFYNIDEILEGDLKFGGDSNDVSQDCMDLIVKILNRTVRDRPTIDDIYNDKWLVI